MKACTTKAKVNPSFTGTKKLNLGRKLNLRGDDLRMSAAVSLVAEEEYRDPSESDQYHIIELIGSGATGTVYKAKVKDKGELVAIKQLRYDNSQGTPHFVMREISDLKRLNGSPHIVR